METSKLIKRLELIKTLITLGEVEDISTNIEKLPDLPQLTLILSAIRKKRYADAVRFIERFIADSSGLIPYIDAETEALKFELKLMESTVSAISTEKAEATKRVSDFELRYHHVLGSLIAELLQLRREKLAEEAEQNPDKKTEYEDAKTDEEDFHRQTETLREKNVAELSDEDKEALKVAYRKASKLCHPDMVEQGRQDEAKKIFQELQSAYESNDLAKVQEIFRRLETGVEFSSVADTTNEKAKLKAEIERLEALIAQLRQELTELQNSESYKTITEIENTEAYFAEKKKQFEAEIERLKK